MSRLSWKWRKRSSVKINGERDVKKQRKNYTAEEKVAILREHLLEKVPISDLWVKKRCDDRRRDHYRFGD